MTKELEFSKKYNRNHAERYLAKHQAGLSRRVSNWRENQIARQALEFADEPHTVLDLPCGTGRFWPMLMENKNRIIFAADNSEDMLAVAKEAQSHRIGKNIQIFKTSAFDISLPNDFVDSIFCMRLLHHIGGQKDRQKILQEFYRVSRDSVIISLWVDGNIKAYRRKRVELRRKTSAYQNRFVISVNLIESEFKAAGFEIQNYIDFLPFIHMWRIYILRKPQNKYE
ncbi:SAM-dependent methyltransferase [Pseudomonas fluorescens]|uniref:SAM-dependent methyltransferase n=1 Tax=Pseudomonas fluorescens TaxID=294 RepID=A0A1T2ZAC0_PSEFL|nr:class I SAM-dependent methyltransferase [Pseudomonas fluorescens]OPB00924.1 SAM-dependent methyltransferase [Pseudomonas fluorescens]